MPKIAEYDSGEGYFIRARPPDIGFITYQVHPAAERILEKLDYQEGDNIGWNLINALRELDFVYTQSGGVDEEEQRDLLNNEEEEYSINGLSEQQIQILLTELEVLPNVSSGQIESIKNIVRIKNTDKPSEDSHDDRCIESRIDDLQKEINARISKSIDDNRFVSEFLNHEGPELVLSAEVVENNKKERDIRLRTSFGLREILDFGPGYFALDIYITESEGIEEFVVTTDATVSQEFKAEAYKLVGDLVSIIISALNHKKVDTGSSYDQSRLRIEPL